MWSQSPREPQGGQESPRRAPAEGAFKSPKSPRELQEPEMAGLLKRMKEKREASEQGSKTRILRPRPGCRDGVAKKQYSSTFWTRETTGREHSSAFEIKNEQIR